MASVFLSFNQLAENIPIELVAKLLVTVTVLISEKEKSFLVDVQDHF
jgi:hypothetical protein